MSLPPNSDRTICHSRDGDSSDQPMFFLSSIIHVWWSRVAPGVILSCCGLCVPSCVFRDTCGAPQCTRNVSRYVFYRQTFSYFMSLIYLCSAFNKLTNSSQWLNKIMWSQFAVVLLIQISQKNFWIGWVHRFSCGFPWLKWVQAFTQVYGHIQQVFCLSRSLLTVVMSFSSHANKRYVKGVIETTNGDYLFSMKIVRFNWVNSLVRFHEQKVFFFKLFLGFWSIRKLRIKTRSFPIFS